MPVSKKTAPTTIDQAQLQTICTALNILPSHITGIFPLGGMTNRNFRIETAEDAFAVRLAGEWANEMIERKGEFLFTRLADELKIHAEVLHFDLQSGLKICRFLSDATTMTPEALRQPHYMQKAAELLHRLHHCEKTIPIPFQFSQKAALYESLLQRHTNHIFDNYATVRNRVAHLADFVDAMGGCFVPCHNDPVPENFLVNSNDQLFLLDWEYGGMNDSMWDLAALSVECEWTAQEEQRFLELYFGEPIARQDHKRFLAYKIFPDFLWSLWGKLRFFAGVEGADMDYDAYANMRFARAKANLTRFENLLL